MTHSKVLVINLTRLNCSKIKKTPSILCVLNRLWWPSGLSRHVSNSSRDRSLGPRFESHLRQVFIWYHNGPALNTLPNEYGCSYQPLKWAQQSFSLSKTPIQGIERWGNLQQRRWWNNNKKYVFYSFASTLTYKYHTALQNWAAFSILLRSFFLTHFSELV